MWLSSKYQLKQWTSFDEDMIEAFWDFFHDMSKFPKYVSFNKHTYEQICFLCSFSPFRDEMMDVGGEEEIQIGSFVNEYCTMDCGINDDLKDKEFEMIWDDGDLGGDDDNKTPNDPSDYGIFKEEVELVF